jgi:hypothetical protein
MCTCIQKHQIFSKLKLAHPKRLILPKLLTKNMMK